MKAEFNGKIFGRDVKWEYSQNAVSYAIVILRIVMGWTFLQAGLSKLLAPEPFSAAGYLMFAIPETNPFIGFFHSIAGNPLVDALNVYGQIAIGLALILGVAVRFTSLMGATMMILYWATALTGGIDRGFPLEHGWVVDDHMVYAIVLFGLGALGAGRILGVDGLIEKYEIAKTRAAELVLG